MGRPKIANPKDDFLHLRIDPQAKEALRLVTQAWDERAQAMGAKASAAGVVRELILREAKELGFWPLPGSEAPIRGIEKPASAGAGSKGEKRGKKGAKTS